MLLSVFVGRRRKRPVDAPVIVASKPFGESYLLAEMFSQLLEARGLRVDRRPGLGATEIAFRALRTGAIDVYPEYTGTGLLAILGEPPLASASAVYQRVVERVSVHGIGVRWLAPLGFQNSYAIAVRRATADSLHSSTLRDLARVGASMRAGLTPDFIGRRRWASRSAARVRLAFQRRASRCGPAVKYQALAAGQVDVIDGYSTDGLIARYRPCRADDDRHFFPPYEAAALVSANAVGATIRDAIAALGELSGRLDESRRCAR